MARITCRNCSGIHLKAGQSRDPEQADVVAGVHHGAKAGEQVTSFGRVGNIHALDDERNVRFRKFLHHIVPLVSENGTEFRNPTTCTWTSFAGRESC